jgi:hypothetical protein
MSFQIKISSLSEKKLTQLKDSLRILAWNEFKQTYKEEISAYPTVLKFYQEVFDPLWQQSEIVKMTMDEVLEYISTLEYTPEDLLKMRKSHYQDKADAKIRFEQKNKPSVSVEDSDF